MYHGLDYKARINWNRGVVLENFVTKTGFGKEKQRENMSLPYDVIAVTEVSPPPFCSFVQNFVKVGKTG
jgi:hypothetical protein